MEGENNEGDEMGIWKPSEAELLSVATLKWSGITTANGEPTMGAWVAEMDFGTSPAVKNRLLTAINNGFLGYPPPWTGPAVVGATVDFQERRFGWPVKPGWVSVVPSILAALRITIDAMTRPGSGVVVPTPAYMPFLTIPGDHGRETYEVPSLHEVSAPDPTQAWSLDLEGIEVALRQGAGLVILCNPWNPTGRVLTTEELRALHDLVVRYDALVFSDEVHSPLVLDDSVDFVSYASLGPTYAAHTITAVAASKAWNIAGLPCAQVIIPNPDLRQRWEDASKGRYGYASPLGELGAVPAYLDSDKWLAEVISQVNANLDLLGDTIRATALDYSRPQATYLTWIGFENVEGATHPAELLRDTYRVGVNAGKSLGTGYHRWIRVNAAMSPDPWQKVVAAIADAARPR